MAMFPCITGIPTKLNSDMQAVLNKKMGTSGQAYPSQTWADEVNLMGKLPEKTASGSIAHIEDGADTVPLKSWDVTVNVNLDGVSSIKVTQAGKNLFNKNDSSSIVVGSFSSSGYSTSGTGARTVYVPIKGGATYTVSKIAGKRFSVATSDVPPTDSATFTSKQDNHLGTEITITAGASDKYLWAWVYLQGEDTSTLADILASIQIEVGSSASTYSAYEAPTVTTVPLGRTIYGGTADVVTGEGVDGYGYIVFDGSSDENWGGYSAYNGYYIGISDMKSGTRQDGVCNQLTCSKSNAQGQTNAFWLGVGNNRFYVIGVYDSMGSTLEAFRTYLSNNPLILAYPLATETDFTFTPITPTPETALGVNNFWADEGDSEVTYRADISLLLNSLQNNRGLMMMRPVNTEEIEYEEGEYNETIR